MQKLLNLLTWISITGFAVAAFAVLMLSASYLVPANVLASFAVFLILSAGTWLILSFRMVQPDEVGVISWFGHISESGDPLQPGLRFVPWAPGAIDLIRVPTKLFNLLFARGSQGGDMPFIVRAKRKKSQSGKELQPIKLEVDATFFLRPAHKEKKSLKLLIQSGVPIHDEVELKEWIRRSIADDIMLVFGEEYYEDVMGGQANDRLNDRINDRLRSPGSDLRISGIFGKNPSNTAPGTGEANLRIQFVHLPQKVSEGITEVESEKFVAEASENTKRQKANVSRAGQLDRLMDEWVRQEAARMGKSDNLAEAIKSLKKDGSYDRQRRYFNDLLLAESGSLNINRIEVGNPDGTSFSFKERTPLGPYVVGMATAVATAVAKQLGIGQGSQGGGSSSKKGGGKKKKASEMSADEIDEELGDSED